MRLVPDGDTDVLHTKAGEAEACGCIFQPEGVDGGFARGVGVVGDAAGRLIGKVVDARFILCGVGRCGPIYLAGFEEVEVPKIEQSEGNVDRTGLIDDVWFDVRFIEEVTAVMIVVGHGRVVEMIIRCYLVFWYALKRAIMCLGVWEDTILSSCYAHCNQKKDWTHHG